MESIIVEVYLPGVNQSYDFMTPSQIPVKNLIGEMVKTITDCTNNAMVDPNTPVLCSGDEKTPLFLEKSLAENGIRDGSRLILI